MARSIRNRDIRTTRPLTSRLGRDIRFEASQKALQRNQKKKSSGGSGG